MDGLRHEGITGVVAAGGFSGFLSRCGRVWMCGMNWDGQLGLGHKSNALLPEIVSDFSSADDPCAGATLDASGAPVVGGVAAGVAGVVAGKESEDADTVGNAKESLGDEERGQQGLAVRFVPEISALSAGSADVLSGSNRLSSTGFVVAVDRQGRVWSWVSFCRETCIR